MSHGKYSHKYCHHRQLLAVSPITSVFCDNAIGFLIQVIYIQMATYKNVIAFIQTCGKNL
jgi:hypothetical protein